VTGQPATRRGQQDFAARVAEAQQLIGESIVRSGLQRDPHRHVLEATASAIGLFPKLVEHLEATRKPVRDEDMRQAVAQGIAGHAWRFVQAMSVRNILLAAGMLVAALSR
jgi:hypothetical protein